MPPREHCGLKRRYGQSATQLAVPCSCASRCFSFVFAIHPHPALISICIGRFGLLRSLENVPEAVPGVGLQLPDCVS